MRIKSRSRNSHKGDYGHVFVIAGSLGMTGAAYLSCEAALLSGAGLLTLGLPKSLNPIMERRLIEEMTLPLPETKEASLSAGAYKKILSFSARADSILIGPGLSRNNQTQALARKLIKNLKAPLVIDADALNAVAGHTELLAIRSKRGLVTAVTPHPGEFSMITGRKVSEIQKNRKNIAKEFAVKYNITTILKGHRTVVAAPGRRPYINSTGNPGMASAGSGDVLAGIVTAFIAQGMDAFEAGALGVYLHGLSGDMAAEIKGEVSLRAMDILKFLPRAVKKLYG